MIRESRGIDDSVGLAPPTETEDQGEWFEVCSTLCADLRRNTIEHIILRRKRSTQLLEAAKDHESDGAGITSEQQFVIEPVVNFDNTLADAIESILDTSDQARFSHQRNASSSTTASKKASQPPSSLPISSAGQRSAPRLLRTDCRQVVAEALEEVVQSVKNDLNQPHNGRAVESLPGRVEEASEVNVLTEGVRRWLLNEEMRSVW